MKKCNHKNTINLTWEAEGKTRYDALRSECLDCGIILEINPYKMERPYPTKMAKVEWVGSLEENRQLNIKTYGNIFN